LRITVLTSLALTRTQELPLGKFAASVDFQVSEMVGLAVFGLASV
jgi:hypothetical protein